MSGTLSIGNETLFTHSDSTGMAYGSGIPAGTVIQVVQDSWQGKTSSLSNSSVWTATGLEKDIQISSGNYVLVECVLAVEVITSGTNGLVALASGANNTTVDSSDFIINPWMIQGLSVAAGGHARNSGWWPEPELPNLGGIYL